MNGRLLVLEGPDGVGKTTLAEMLLKDLKGSGLAATLLSFPGRRTETLGAAVYDLHHGDLTMTEAARQTLHLAAHLDAIEREILPRLERGEVVILDRYTWSMPVYGIARGVPYALMQHLLACEITAWQGRAPNVLWLVEREGADPVLAGIYRDLFRDITAFPRWPLKPQRFEVVRNVELGATHQRMLGHVRSLGLVVECKE